MKIEIICYGYHQFEQPGRWTPTGPPASYPSVIVEAGDLPPGWIYHDDWRYEFSANGGHVLLCPQCALRWLHTRVAALESKLQELQAEKERREQGLWESYQQHLQDISLDNYRAVCKVMKERSEVLNELRRVSAVCGEDSQADSEAAGPADEGNAGTGE